VFLGKEEEEEEEDRDTKQDQNHLRDYCSDLIRAKIKDVGEDRITSKTISKRK
jgi:hypothetical protein